MIKTIRLLCGFMAIAMMAFVVSCSDDPSVGGGGSVPVADGFYVAKVGVTPTENDGLAAEVVEGDAFGTLTRDGYLTDYVYLTAGDYNIVNVIDQEIAQTYGGTSGVADSAGSECNLINYTLVPEYEVDGAAITISSAGLYKVGVDVDTKEIWFYKIEKAHVIGGATTFGWSQSDAGEMTVLGTPSASEITWKITGISMRKGDYKFRFNCTWLLDRRITTVDHAPANGYSPFTNLGVSEGVLAAGGANLTIPFGGDGSYTITLTWTPDGFTYTTHNDVPVAPKVPNTYAWGIIGSATPIIDWSADTNLPLLAGSTATAATYEVASIALSEGGEFKFRAEDAWGIVLKPGIDILGTVTGDSNFESTGGGDPSWKVKVGGAGNYKVTIATTNTGEKWNITFVKL
jgi:hypothetical protein